MTTQGQEDWFLTLMNAFEESTQEVAQALEMCTAPSQEFLDTVIAQAERVIEALAQLLEEAEAELSRRQANAKNRQGTPHGRR